MILIYVTLTKKKDSTASEGFGPSAKSSVGGASEYGIQFESTTAKKILEEFGGADSSDKNNSKLKFLKH